MLIAQDQILLDENDEMGNDNRYLRLDDLRFVLAAVVVKFHHKNVNDL